MISNKLKLNDSKTEIVHISNRYLQENQFPALAIGDALIEPSLSARNLGVTFDRNLLLSDHMAKMCKSASFGLYKIGKLRPYLDRNTTERLVHAYITSRLDFCNSLLYGLPDNLVAKLQLLQNAAARMVTRAKGRDHITPILNELHWLPIRKRIAYKIALLTFKALHNQAPQYIIDLIEPYSPSRTLRSSSKIMLRNPPISKSCYGQRSFSSAAPKIWNKLPTHVRSATSLSQFKSGLKTHLFNSDSTRF